MKRQFLPVTLDQDDFVLTRMLALVKPETGAFMISKDGH